MILLLDNYDSFVHNLARYFRRLGCETLVVRSDQISVTDCQQLNPEAIVISPGPGRPTEAGCSVDLIRRLDRNTPLLGVCLGHQAIGAAFGGRVVPCGPMHGMASAITHDGKGVFAGCPTPLHVGRYHSLAIDSSGFPQELEISARSDDGVIMGVRHRSRPIFGVQFHPESVLTREGARVIENFVRRAHQARRDRGHGSGPPTTPHSLTHPVSEATSVGEEVTS